MSSTSRSTDGASPVTGVPLCVFPPIDVEKLDAQTLPEPQKDEKFRELQDVVAELRDICESLVAVHEHALLKESPVSSETFRKVVDDLCACWAEYEEADRQTHILLALLQGFAERIVNQDLTQKALVFFDRHLQLIRESRTDPVAMENEARTFGLPVCDPEEPVLEVTANFGIVESVDDRGARVVLLDDTDGHVLEDSWSRRIGFRGPIETQTWASRGLNDATNPE